MPYAEAWIANYKRLIELVDDLDQPFVIGDPGLGIRPLAVVEKDGLGLVVMPVGEVVVRPVPDGILLIVTPAGRVAALGKRPVNPSSPSRPIS